MLDRKSARRCFLLTLLVATVSAADSPKVLTAEDFVNHSVPRCSSGNSISFLLQINAQLPPYQFTLTPQPGTAPDGSIRHVGRIEISKARSGTILQTIEVNSIWNDTLCRFFDAMDVNFDGYLDIAVVRDGGAKWASRDYYLFDPQSGRFITNALTHELSQLQSNGIVLEAKTREIRAPFPRGACGGEDIYGIENGQLTKIQEDEVTGESESSRCLHKVHRRVDGEWKVVRVESTKALY